MIETVGELSWANILGAEGELDATGATLADWVGEQGLGGLVDTDDEETGGVDWTKMGGLVMFKGDKTI